MKKRDEIPTVKLGQGKGKSARTHTKKPAKAKVKAQAKPKPKAKVKAKAVKAKQREKAEAMRRPPVGLAPPAMKDTRPTPTPTPTPSSSTETAPTASQAKVTTPSSPPSPTPSSSAPTPAATTTETHDAQLVQGATCTWIGNMSDAPDNDDDPPVPVCPHCGGHLLTVPGGAEVMRLGFEQYELGAYTSVNPPPKRHPGFVKFMDWVIEQSKSRCWQGADLAAAEYLTETGIQVDPSR